MTGVIATVSVAANTFTGLQTITTSDLGGLTPKGMRIIATQATADDTPASGLVISIGYTDGTTHSSCSIAAEDGGANSDTRSLWSDTDVLDHLLDDGTRAGTCDLASGGGFIADGVKLNWTVALASAVILKIVFYAGTDCEVVVGSDRTIATTTETITIGHESEFVHMMAAGAGVSGGDVSQGKLSVGVTDTSVIDSNTFYWRDGQSTSKVVSHNSTTKILTEVGSTSGLVTDSITIDNFTAVSGGQFDLTPAVDYTDSNISWFSVTFNGTLNIKLQTYSSPTATGISTISGLTGTPQYCELTMNMMDARDTVYTNIQDKSCVFGVSIMTATDEQSAVIYDDVENTTIDSNSLVDSVAVNLVNDVGTLMYKATLDSFNDGNVKLDFTTEADSAARMWSALTIEEGAAGGGGGASAGVIFIGL